MNFFNSSSIIFKHSSITNDSSMKPRTGNASGITSNGETKYIKAAVTAMIDCKDTFLYRPEM